MDRESKVGGWGGHAMVGQESLPELPQHLAAPLDAGEIGDMLRARAHRAYLEGIAAGDARASERWERMMVAEVRAESTRWVEVTLDLLIAELGAVEARAVVALRKTGEPRATKAQIAKAVEIAHDAMLQFRARLRELLAQVGQDGINP